MNIIVAGSRTFNDYEFLRSKLDFYFSNRGKAIQIICGEAEGADQLGKRYAIEKGYNVLSFPDQSEIFGSFAKFKRNREMARAADGLVAFWVGESKGTAQLIQVMKETGKPIRIVYYKEASSHKDDQNSGYMNMDSPDYQYFDA